MISKNRIKLISSLHLSKYRKKYHLFIVEGTKMTFEALHSELSVESIYATGSWIAEHQKELDGFIRPAEISMAEMKKISALNSPSEVLAVMHWEEKESIPNPESQLILALDDIQDPGNLGTIIRTADWFGIDMVLCSSNTVSCYNPKVVQASMGSIFHIPVVYKNLEEYFSTLDTNIPVYGTFLDGENMLKAELKSTGIIVIGNEGKGISPDLEPLISHRLRIPDFNPNSGTPFRSAESLNASIATAIMCYEFRRMQ